MRKLAIAAAAGAGLYVGLGAAMTAVILSEDGLAPTPKGVAASTLGWGVVAFVWYVGGEERADALVDRLQTWVDG